MKGTREGRSIIARAPPGNTGPAGHRWARARRGEGVPKEAAGTGGHPGVSPDNRSGPRPGVAPRRWPGTGPTHLPPACNTAVGQPDRRLVRTRIEIGAPARLAAPDRPSPRRAEENTVAGIIVETLTRPPAADGAPAEVLESLGRPLPDGRITEQISPQASLCPVGAEPHSDHIRVRGPAHVRNGGSLPQPGLRKARSAAAATRPTAALPVPCPPTARSCS
jgi:hypothetical protein